MNVICSLWDFHECHLSSNIAKHKTCNILWNSVVLGGTDVQAQIASLDSLGLQRVYSLKPFTFDHTCRKI